MKAILATEPQVEPVSIAEAKAHMNITTDADDAVIEALIRTARQRLDGTKGLLGRALVTQKWSVSFPRFCDRIVLPLAPVQSVDAITYLDAAGVEITLDPDIYLVEGLGGEEPAIITLARGKSWPSTGHYVEAVAISFTAGYGDDPEDVPEPIRTAIKMHVAHLYENREISTASPIQTVPFGYDELIADYRQWGF